MAPFWGTTGGLMQEAAAYTFLAQAVGANWEYAIEAKLDEEQVTVPWRRCTSSEP